MFVLHVDLIAKEGFSDALEETYRRVFRPAISKQPGFSDVKLLLARSSNEDRTHRLVIEFEREELQRGWVTTDLHEQVAKELFVNVTEASAAEFLDIA